MNVIQFKREIMEQPKEGRAIELPNPKQLLEKMFIVKDGKFYRPNVLEKCFDRGSISELQYRAGMIMFEDAYFGLILSGLKGMDPTRASEPRTRNYKPTEMTYDQARSHKNWSDAFYNERLGDIQRQILWHVVVNDKPISDAAKERHYALGLLRETLNDLVRYYQIMKRL